MVQTFYVNVREFADPMLCGDILSVFSKERREKISRLKRVSDRKLSFGAGLLLNFVLKNKGLSHSDVYTEKNGKPMANGLYFSLSHSEDIAVCSVSDVGNVGVDVQFVKEMKCDISKKYFSPNEKKYLNSVDESKRNSELIRLWTFKESYLKMTGEGLTVPTDSFEVEMRELHALARNGGSVACHFSEYFLWDYKLTVCSEDRDFSAEAVELSAKDLMCRFL